MIEVEVLIDNFKDLENFNKPTKVKRNGQEIILESELLQKGDIYEITKERYSFLSEKKYVAKISKKEKKEE